MKLAQKIRELIEILRSEDLDEIEVRTLWSSVRIARGRTRQAGEFGEARPRAQAAPGAQSPGSSEPEAEAAPQTGPAATGAAAAPAMAPEPTGAAAPADTAQPLLEEIRSPMVGTFFRAATPEADPFVAEGSRVEVGQVLCVIEAMKLMNEIEAEKSGIIRRILVKDSQPVEFDQPLFLMESA